MTTFFSIIIIQSIFKKEKLKNFDKNANTLFCFSISNVKRYDGIIYIPEKESVLLLKASIHKSKLKLAKYTEENMTEDIQKMEKRFFNPNKISPKKYYLIFILDYETYQCNPDYMKELENFKFHYCFYDPNKNMIDYQYIKDYKLNEIGLNPYDLDGEKEEKENIEFFFFKQNKFKPIQEKDIEHKPGYYCVEKGIDLLSFLEETCPEYDKLIDNISKMQNHYCYFKLKSFSENFCFYSHSPEQNKKVIIVLFNKDLILGESILSQDSSKMIYKWTKYNKDWFEVEIKKLNESESKFIKNISGFFIFESLSNYL